MCRTSPNIDDGQPLPGAVAQKRKKSPQSGQEWTKMVGFGHRSSWRVSMAGRPTRGQGLDGEINVEQVRVLANQRIAGGLRLADIAHEAGIDVRPLRRFL